LADKPQPTEAERATLIAWRDIEPAHSFGYLVPPNWSSANRVYRNCPRAITGQHSGIEHSRLYARAIIEAPRAMTLWAGVGVCQHGKLWLGDRLLWTSPTDEPPGELEHVSLVQIPFTKGRNVLTLRCDVDYASPSFWLRLCTRGRPADEAAAAAREERIATARAAVQRPAVSGWRGDGTGADDSDAPLAWHYKKGHNVRWQTELPYWSNATPALAGDRLFVAIEPDTLICLHADTGEQLWERRVSIIDTLPAAQRDEGDRLRAAWWEARQEHGFEDPPPKAMIPSQSFCS